MTMLCTGTTSDRSGYYAGGDGAPAGTHYDQTDFGYDRASNRRYRENTLTTGRDELYGYDEVGRLIAFQRGELNVNKDGITGTPPREEDWSLDMTGNWPGYVQKNSGSTDLARTIRSTRSPPSRPPPAPIGPTRCTTATAT